MRTPRPFDDAHRARVVAGGLVILDGAALPGVVALALAADGDATVSVEDGETPSYRIGRELTLAAGERVELAFYLAAGAEGDGAEAAVTALRRRGWRGLLAATRDALLSLEQSTGHDGTDRLVNRNLLFAYFYGVGRALDDAHFYLVRSRSPWNGYGVTVPRLGSAHVDAAGGAARRSAARPRAAAARLRAARLRARAAARTTWTVPSSRPDFRWRARPPIRWRSIATSGARATTRWWTSRRSADALYLAADDIAARRDKRLPLYATEVDPAGEQPVHPFTLHGNAVAALAFEVLRRTLDEEAAREVEDPDAVRAALLRQFVTQRERQGRLRRHEHARAVRRARPNHRRRPRSGCRCTTRVTREDSTVPAHGA